MPVKESSDELNPAVIVSDAVVPSRPARNGKDYLALAVATCGVGYIPVAPGTFGSLVGLGLWAGVRGTCLAIIWPLAGPGHNLLQIHFALVACLLVTAALITWLGTWAGERVERLHGVKDPQKVVIDEVAGQFIALTAVPLPVDKWWTIVVAFLLFRFFDIVKPHPASRFEQLHGGLGIMADDVVAGIYAAICLAAIVSVAWFM